MKRIYTGATGANQTGRFDRPDNRRLGRHGVACRALRSQPIIGSSRAAKRGPSNSKATDYKRELVGQNGAEQQKGHFVARKKTDSHDGAL